MTVGLLVVTHGWEGRLLLAGAWFCLGAALVLERRGRAGEEGRRRTVATWGFLATGVLLLLVDALR